MGLDTPNTEQQEQLARADQVRGQLPSIYGIELSQEVAQVTPEVVYRHEPALDAQEAPRLFGNQLPENVVPLRRDTVSDVVVLRTPGDGRQAMTALVNMRERSIAGDVPNAA